MCRLCRSRTDGACSIVHIGFPRQRVWPCAATKYRTRMAALLWNHWTDRGGTHPAGAGPARMKRPSATPRLAPPPVRRWVTRGLRDILVALRRRVPTCSNGLSVTGAGWGQPATRRLRVSATFTCSGGRSRARPGRIAVRARHRGIADAHDSFGTVYAAASRVSFEIETHRLHGTRSGGEVASANAKSGPKWRGGNLLAVRRQVADVVQPKTPGTVTTARGRSVRLVQEPSDGEGHQ